MEERRFTARTEYLLMRPGLLSSGISLRLPAQNAKSLPVLRAERGPLTGNTIHMLEWSCEYMIQTVKKAQREYIKSITPKCVPVIPCHGCGCLHSTLVRRDAVVKTFQDFCEKFFERTFFMQDVSRHVWLGESSKIHAELCAPRVPPGLNGATRTEDKSVSINRCPLSPWASVY